MIYDFAYSTIFVSIILTLWRLLIGPKAVDRIVAVDLLVTFLGCLIIIYILQTGEVVFLDTILVITLMGFFGAVLYCRYLERTIEKAENK